MHDLYAKDRLNGALILDLEVGSKVGLDLPYSSLQVQCNEEIVHMDWHEDLDTIMSVHID